MAIIQIELELIRLLFSVIFPSLRHFCVRLFQSIERSEVLFDIRYGLQNVNFELRDCTFTISSCEDKTELIKMAESVIEQSLHP